MKGEPHSSPFFYVKIMETSTLKKINYPEKWSQSRFFQMTKKMFECVATHNYEELSRLCDDDYGIIDINPEGGSEIMRDRLGWENWFKGLFVQLQKMEAETWSVITQYEEFTTSELSYSVVDFDQFFVHEGKTLKFDVIATIIWKKVGENHWQESRYHSSLKKVEEIK